MSKIIEVTDETHALLKIVAAKKGIYIKDWVRDHAREDAIKLGLPRWFPDKFLDE